jgi:hypothetical protein
VNIRANAWITDRKIGAKINLFVEKLDDMKTKLKNAEV